MFHRRRAASNPPIRQPTAPSSAAALAASQAFLKDRVPNASLSNAAAAAALRTHATSPTPVGDIQTKRMIRRGSTSSQGSVGSNQAPGLRRQSSSGSMSERTFRTSSPNRSSPVVEADPNAPPVPAIPRDVPSPVSQKRASSLEPVFRGASPRRGGGRGVSVDRGMPAAGRGHVRGGSNLAQVMEVDRENSIRSSVNFSRPMSPPASPTPSPVVAPGRAGHSGWFGSPVVANKTFRDDSATRPKTSDGAGIRNSFAQESIRNAPEMPVHKNRSQFSAGVEGARLASGHMGARPTGTAVDEYTRPATSSGLQAVDPKSPGAVYDPSTRKFYQREVAQPAYQEPVYHAVERPQSPPVQRQERPQSPPMRQNLSSGFQTRAGALLARRNSEDYGESDQEQGGHDANTSRRLEPSSSGLNREQVQTTPVSTGPPSTPAQPRTQTPTNTLSAGKNGSIRGDRPQSLSPGRSAHFATSSVELPNGFKHHPPPRSYSPAKSALKHSPSSSIRNNSPVVIAARGAPSEGSDNMSDDGSRSTPRRKKNVRVSFDEGPVIAGTSAYGETSPSSPTGIDTSKWSSRSPTSPDDNLDDVMTPRPALPSFGSVRERSRRNDDDDLAEKVTETIPSSMSTSASTIAEPLESSNDHALANIIANDFASKKRTDSSSPQEAARKSNLLDPVPPEVTSVEGSGYVSDSEQSVATQDEGPVSSRKGPITAPATLEAPPKREEMAVPDIAILPATPGPEDAPEPKYMMPGGFPDQFEETRAIVKNTEPANAERRTNSSSSTPLKTIEPVAPPPAIIPSQPVVSQEEQLTVVQEEPDSDTSSIYSDAAEDFSDDEAPFASIDAVVDSPITKPARGLAITPPPDSPVMPAPSNASRALQDNATPPSREETDWNDARDHWTSLTQAQRKGLGREAKPEPPTAVATSSNVPILQAAKPRKKNVSSGGASRTGPPPAAAQPRKSAMKNSMRQAQESTAAEPHIRKTMRSGPGFQGNNASSASEPHMKKSMRGGDTMRSGMRNEPGLAASRYSSPPASREPRGALQKRVIPPAAVPAKNRPQSASGPLGTSAKPPQMAPLARTFSNDDSDLSDSSFKRERRRPKGSNGERYSMRRSMRGGPAAPSAPAPTMRPQSAHAQPLSPPPTMRTSMRPSSPTPEAPAGLKSSRFSIRSLSPRGRGIGNSNRNGSIDAGVSTLRAQSEKPGTKMGGFGNKSKAKSPAPSKPAKRFQSRFADSSDEDDDRPARFQSRFADSDEDDDYTLPSGLAPVRGIPRKPGEEDGDSTDLSDEDSSTERPAANKDIEKGTTTNGQPSFASSTLRDGKHTADPSDNQTTKKEKSKRGFFGLGKKKQSASQPGEFAAQPLPIPEPPPHTVRSQPQAQRPLTPIGEDEKVFDAASPDTPQSPGSIRSPKLQRRNTPQWGRSTSDSWPLPQPPAIGQEVRPASSDGVFPQGGSKGPSSLRPTLNKRYSSAVSEARMGIDPKTGKEVVVGRTGKKKRFPMLRKAFGLHD